MDQVTALIVPVPATATDRALVWADLADEERRRRAVAAAQLHEAAALWTLTESWLILESRKGTHLSARTLAAYRAALVPPEATTRMGRRRRCVPLLVAWKEENLLHPGRRAGTRWIRQLEQAGAAPATVQTYLAAARALYHALRDAGATTADPFRDVHPAPDPTPRWQKRRPYTDEELQRLLEGAQGEEALLILLGFHAGLRVSEMVALRWPEVDTRRKTLTVLAGKGGKQRTVRLSRTLLAALEPVRQPEGYVLALTAAWDWREGRAAYDSIAKRRARAWYLLRKRALAVRVSPLGLHALRHSAGARMRRHADIEDTARFLGHAQVQTATIYSHWTDDRVARVIDEW